jgi:hypothetical protein
MGNMRGRGNFEDLSLDGRIVLKWFFRRSDGRALKLGCCG